ncbi:APC family permease [Streptomyces hirsutus]
MVGTITCLYLVLPWSSGRPADQYHIAGILLLIGVVLWTITWLIRRGTPVSDADRPDGTAHH